MIRELISCIRNMPRHTKNALQNIVRNSVMSISSMLTVTITLFLIGVIGVIAINIQDMTVSVEKQLTIYVKLDRETPEEAIASIQTAILGIDHVESAVHSTKEQELEKYIEIMGKIYENYRESNPLGDAFNVEADDGTYLTDIASAIEKLDYVKTVDYGGSSTESLISGLKTIRNFGSIAIVALIVVALFMIANTIKITITSRRTEISIMRMVGASNWYIRIPFVIEGLLIGLLGSLIPIVVIYFGYTFIFNSMNGVFISNLLTIRNPEPFIIYFITFLAGLGSVVGAIGSFMSIRKYLKF